MPEKSKSDQSEGAEVSRCEALKADGVEEPPMPPCSALHIVGYLFEIGPTASNGMGGTPLSFLEIQAWQDCMGVELDAWECRSLRRLSAEYLNEAQRATKPDCKAPWTHPDEVKAAPSRAAEDLRASIRALAML